MSSIILAPEYHMIKPRLIHDVTASKPVSSCQSPHNGCSQSLPCPVPQLRRIDHYTKRCTTGIEASSFSIVSGRPSACANRCGQLVPFLVMLNPCLSQPFSRSIHRSHLVPSLLHAVFDARLSSAGSSSHPCCFPPHLPQIRHKTIAAACIFLATKTEECGRKLRDVARVCQSKAKGIDVCDIPEGSPVRFLLFVLRLGRPTVLSFRKLKRSRAKFSPQRRPFSRPFVLILLSTVHMLT